MPKLMLLTLAAITFASCASQQAPMSSEKIAPDIYSFSYTSIDGEKVPMEKYKGKVLMIVNTASKCGLTPQYKELQAAYDKFKSQGLVIIGFPANDFNGQEPGTESEIKEFCSKNFGVSFPLSSKVVVKGENKTDLYKWLIEKSGNRDEIEWNFGKFIVSRDGKHVTRFSPRMTPDSKEVIAAIEKDLATSAK